MEKIIFYESIYGRNNVRFELAETPSYLRVEVRDAPWARWLDYGFVKV